MPLDLESRVCANLGRFLLLSTTILLVAMPWTEYFWHFDRFLQGGQDFELSLLALLAVLCLMLVLFQKGKRDLQIALSLCSWLATIYGIECAETMPGALHGLIGPLHAVPLPSPALSKYNLPTQV